MLYNPQPVTVTLYKHTPVGVVHAIKGTKKHNVHVNSVSMSKPHSEEKDYLFEIYLGTPYYDLLLEFSDVTAHAGYDLGQTHIVQHEIPLLNAHASNKDFTVVPMGCERNYKNK